ncbi:MAG: TauD/TfdA family dioxygenase [Actinomycetota bacterium]
MAPVVEPLDATLGAVVTGLSVGHLSDGDWEVVADAFLQHALLVFPSQHLDDEQQRAFGERFGELDILVRHRGGTVAITNQRPDGSVVGDDHQALAVMRGNEGWHTDSSYMPVAAKASVLSARVVPPEGGETEWADMRAAYDALDEETRERIADLAAYHSLVYSQARAGADQRGGYGIDQDAMPLRPLVKVHPETGRPALYIGRHAHDIPGLDSAESEALLDGLMDEACRPPRLYRHRWRVGDVIAWDNRAVLHRAHPFDYREPRVMVHTRIAGDAVAEAGIGSRPTVRT